MDSKLEVLLVEYSTIYIHLPLYLQGNFGSEEAYLAEVP